MVNPSSATPRPLAEARPDAQGHFGIFGGRFVPETLMPALEELEDAYRRLRKDGLQPERVDGSARLEASLS